MNQRSIPGNQFLAQAIRSRRSELNLTIEEAAKRAGVGTKTWCRYEAGEAIRNDKCKGICKALNWRKLPINEEENKKNETLLNISDYRKSEYWSKIIEKEYGETAALSFIIGSELLEDYIITDIDELSKMPKGSHIGELGASLLVDRLPKQFLIRYDYEFLFAMQWTLNNLKIRIKNGTKLIVHSVMEELIIYLIVDEARTFLEDMDYKSEEGWDEWIFDIFDDMDIETVLYSGIIYVTDNVYHFNHWMEEQFYMK